jgi:hypothetical protein
MGMRAVKPGALIVSFLLAIPLPATAEKRGGTLLPTHADAAVIFAKHTGFFDRYVDSDAALTECVTFLNETGIYFGLMEIVNGKEFTVKDCARVMGQIELVLAGEAEYVAGKVKLPKGIDSWVDFCIMNGVEYVEGYQTIVQTLNSVGK